MEAEVIPKLGVEGFFAFLRERYRIHLRRCSGQAAPWTEDPILRAWRFCNVRREDDKVTEWFRANIRGPLRNDSKVLFATIAFRWFNTIFTGEILKSYLLKGEWPRHEIEYMLGSYREEGIQIFTGAFMINSAPGKPKHVDVLDNLSWVRGNTHSPFFGRAPEGLTKEQFFNEVLRIPRLGNFAAYQVVVDLQYTYLLESAPDLQTFTVAGPGCAKGLGLCFHEDPTHFKYGSKADQVAMLTWMRSLLADSRDSVLWPSAWPPFYLSDIENGLCEYAKWRSGHAGLRLKRKFTPCT
jgi:hypothetical protein